MANFNDFTFSGPLGEYINGLIALKKGQGYDYLRQSEVLKRFNLFCTEHYPNEHTVTKPMVDAWLNICGYGVPKTKRHMMTPISHLAQYMCNLGVNAYIFPTNTLPKEQRYTPHIYSHEELTRFFAQTDSCCYCSEVPLRHHIMPVFFRLLYCCGLRVSEAINLKTEDVDLDSGVLIIRASKNGSERYVPLSSEMLVRMKSYSQKVHLERKKHLFFFPSPTEKPIAYMNIYGNFRRFLRKAGITHGGRKNAIRIHDFRHTFAVHCLKGWVTEGKDLNSCYPYLRVYMGHTLFRYTTYYLRLTADIYPFITEQLEKTFADVIPVMETEAEYEAE